MTDARYTHARAVVCRLLSPNLPFVRASFTTDVTTPHRSTPKLHGTPANIHGGLPGNFLAVQVTTFAVLVFV